MKKNLMWKIAIIAVLLIIAGGILISRGPEEKSSSSLPGSGKGEVYNVTIRGMAFSPTPLAINTGDTVVWKNFDSVAHTVTSDTGLEMQSGQIKQGESYSHTFTAPGTYSYHCLIHPYMKGTVVVR